METLSEQVWDVVIVGTSLPQALLALSLSRSGLKILHVDDNSYYGGNDAALSLDEARSWAEKNERTSLLDAPGNTRYRSLLDGLSKCSSAVIVEPSSSGTKLSSSRAYTLSLNPQIVYAQSLFLPSLVSSHINEQLEFLAVGSWWVCKDGRLQKVPSSREDVFADDVLSRRDKIGLMKLLRSVVQEESETSVKVAQEEEEVESPVEGETIPLDRTLRHVLSSDYKLAPILHAPILSLALEQQPASAADFEVAKTRIRRHMKSMGHFGPGFGAVIAKYAGTAEIAQVACRACAVGGATYLLGHILCLSDAHSVGKDGQMVNLELTSGITIQAKNLVGDFQNLPRHIFETAGSLSVDAVRIFRSITIVSNPLRSLFTQTAEHGPVPAAVMALVAEDGDDEESLQRPPIYLQIHSDDTGECPQGQSVVYASTLHPRPIEPSETRLRLDKAVQKFLGSVQESHQQGESSDTAPQALWSMSYLSGGLSSSQEPPQPFLQDGSGRIFAFMPSVQDIAFNDNVLESVRAVWKSVLGDAADESNFMRFESRTLDQAD